MLFTYFSNTYTTFNWGNGSRYIIVWLSLQGMFVFRTGISNGCDIGNNIPEAPNFVYPNFTVQVNGHVHVMKNPCSLPPKEIL